MDFAKEWIKSCSYTHKPIEEMDEKEIDWIGMCAWNVRGHNDMSAEEYESIENILKQQLATVR